MEQELAADEMTVDDKTIANYTLRSVRTHNTTEFDSAFISDVNVDQQRVNFLRYMSDLLNTSAKNDENTTTIAGQLGRTIAEIYTKLFTVIRDPADVTFTTIKTKMDEIGQMLLRFSTKAKAAAGAFYELVLTPPTSTEDFIAGFDERIATVDALKASLQVSSIDELMNDILKMLRSLLATVKEEPYRIQLQQEIDHLEKTEKQYGTTQSSVFSFIYNTIIDGFNRLIATRYNAHWLSTDIDRSKSSIVETLTKLYSQQHVFLKTIAFLDVLFSTTFKLDELSLYSEEQKKKLTDAHELLRRFLLSVPVYRENDDVQRVLIALRFMNSVDLQMWSSQDMYVLPVATYFLQSADDAFGAFTTIFNEYQAYIVGTLTLPDNTTESFQREEERNRIYKSQYWSYLNEQQANIAIASAQQAQLQANQIAAAEQQIRQQELVQQRKQMADGMYVLLNSLDGQREALDDLVLRASDELTTIQGKLAGLLENIKTEGLRVEIQKVVVACVAYQELAATYKQDVKYTEMRKHVDALVASPQQDITKLATELQQQYQTLYETYIAAPQKEFTTLYQSVFTPIKALINGTITVGSPEELKDALSVLRTLTETIAIPDAQRQRLKQMEDEFASWKRKADIAKQEQQSYEATLAAIDAINAKYTKYDELVHIAQALYDGILKEMIEKADFQYHKMVLMITTPVEQFGMNQKAQDYVQSLKSGIQLVNNVVLNVAEPIKQAVGRVYLFMMMLISDEDFNVTINYLLHYPDTQQYIKELRNVTRATMNWYMVGIIQHMNNTYPDDVKKIDEYVLKDLKRIRTVSQPREAPQPPSEERVAVEKAQSGAPQLPVTAQASAAVAAVASPSVSQQPSPAAGVAAAPGAPPVTGVPVVAAITQPGPTVPAAAAAIQPLIIPASVAPLPPAAYAGPPTQPPTNLQSLFSQPIRPSTLGQVVSSPPEVTRLTSNLASHTNVVGDQLATTKAAIAEVQRGINVLQQTQQQQEELVEQKRKLAETVEQFNRAKSKLSKSVGSTIASSSISEIIQRSSAGVHIKNPQEFAARLQAHLLKIMQDKYTPGPRPPGNVYVSSLLSTEKTRADVFAPIEQFISEMKVQFAASRDMARKLVRLNRYICHTTSMIRFVIQIIKTQQQVLEFRQAKNVEKIDKDILELQRKDILDVLNDLDFELLTWTHLSTVVKTLYKNTISLTMKVVYLCQLVITKMLPKNALSALEYGMYEDSAQVMTGGLTDAGILENPPNAAAPVSPQPAPPAGPLPTK